MDPLNLSQRGNFSREGLRVPSRERQTNTPEVRKKINTSKTGLGVSGQNFVNISQRDQQENSSSSTDDLMLASINIAVDETAFVSTTKADLLQLQEEINKLDVDGKIRSINPSNILKKNHIHSMARFLSKYSNMNIKTLMDKRLSHATSFDTQDLLKFMGVKTESDGLRKLFKMLGVLDLMLVKLTEYQIVSFLGFDQTFENLKKQFGGQPPTKTATMDSGISVSRFQPDLANMERMTELYGFVKKLSQQNKASNSKTNLNNLDDNLRNICTVDDLYKALKNGQSSSLNEELATNLINLIERSSDYKVRENSLTNRIKALEKEVNEKSSKLTTIVDFSSTARDDETPEDLREKITQLKEETETMKTTLEAQYKKNLNELKEKTRKIEYEIETKNNQIQDLQGEISKLKTSNETVKMASKGDVFNSEYYIKMLKQIEDNYTQKSKEVELDNHKKDQEIINLKTKLEMTDRERTEFLAAINKYENQELADSRARMKGSDNSFEAALREQFENMKQGFEDKIKNFSTEIQQTKKDKSLEILELKRELIREKENRDLLLRKLQIYTKS